MSDAGGREPLNVPAQRAGLITLGTGGAIMLATLAFLLGGVSGGVVLPFLRANAPDSTEKAAEAEQILSELRVSLAPQEVWAPPKVGADPIPTGISLGQLIEEMETRGRRAGKTSTVDVVRDGATVRIRLGFRDLPDDAAGLAPQPQQRAAHPGVLELVLGSGPAPGTIMLQQTLADGEPVGTGAAFVDLVTFGGISPPLADGEFLTRRGVFELKASPDGPMVALVDGSTVYPASAPTDAAGASTPPTAPVADADGTAPAFGPEAAAPPFQPVRLTVTGALPAQGPFRELIVLTGETASTEPCSARAILHDSVLNVVKVLPAPITAGNLIIQPGRGVVGLGGFCDESAPAQQAGPGEPPVEPARYRVDAIYNQRSGTVSWNRVLVPKPVPVAVPPAGPQGAAAPAAAGPWRASPGRIASPILPGGVLLSASCSGRGDLSIAAAGLPAPAQGEAGMNVTFRSGGGVATARMRWAEAARSYDLSAASRPRELEAVWSVLRAGGTLTMAGGGASHTLPHPGTAALDRLRRNCQPPDTAPVPQPPAGEARPGVAPPAAKIPASTGNR
jgi:hypothetical protein